ncbi:hypothetical protein [Frankia sp. Cas4]|uniref:hypothetical protein n=1 Tax=Frankia sp. Cas4 TaxID=3073927 RepID=UPI002AD2CE40|nr:hypothetical protein [Frankia sp. Cas4]
MGSNPTGGTYSIDAAGTSCGCRAGRRHGGRFREVGDLIKVGGRNFDHHLYLLILMVDVDGELRDLVEASLQRLGRLAERELELR